jgi:hypothetical protein
VYVLSLNDINGDRDLVNRIDWDMTPEKAVSLYLEWGNGWNHGVSMVKSTDDESLYFVVYSWEDGPVLHLVRRDMNGAEELAIIPIPEDLRERFSQEWGGHKGVYALNQEIGDWLRESLGVSDMYH